MRRSEKARRKRLGNNIPAVAHGAEDDTDAFIRSVEHSAKKIMSDMVSRKMRNLKGRGRSTASKKGSGEGLGSSAPSSLRGLPAISTAGATSFEKSLYSSPLAGASSKPALQREVARLMARNRRRDDKAAAKLVRGGKTPKKKRGERVPRGGAAAAAVMGEGGMYRAQDAEHALRTRRSVVAWMDPDAQTELDRGLRSSKMLREIAKPLAGAKGHGTEDASGRVWKKKVSSTQQGPTAWSSIELRLKYRDESGRNAAWQASVEAQAVAEKVLREEGRVLPVVEIVQHPLQLSTARGLAEENARSQERARLRNSRRFFNLDMRAVWQSHDRDRINVRPRKELVLEARGEMHIRQPGETRMPTPWKGIDTTSMDPWQVQSVRKQQSVQSAWRGYGEADIGVGEVDIGLEGELPPPAIAEWHRFGGGGTRVLLRADGTDDVVDLPPGCSAAVAAQLVQEHDAKLTARHRREGTFESKYLLVSVHLGRSRVRIVAIDPKDVETTAMGTAVVEDASGAWQAPEEGSQKGTAEEQLSPEELEALEVERALAEAMGSDSDDGEAEEKESANVIPVAEASGGGDGHGHGVYVPEVEPRLQWIGSYESVAWLLGLPEVPTVAATSKSYSAPLPGDNAEEFRIEQKGLLRRMQKGLLRRLELVPGNTSSKVVHQHVHADTAEPDVKTTPMLDGQLSAAERQAAKDGDKVVVRLDWLAPEKGVIVPASYTVRGGQDVTGDVPGITIIDNPHRWDADTRVHSEVFDGEQSEFEAKWIAAQDDAALRRARRQRWETTGPSSLKQQQQQATASGDQAEAGGAPAGAGGGGTASVTEEDEEDYDCSEEDEVRDSELSEDETEWDMGAEEKELSRAARRRRTRWERWRARTPDERLRRVLMRSKDMGETLRIQQRLETRRRHWIRKQRRHLLPSPIEELSRKVDREGMGKCDQVLPPGCNTAGHSTAVFIRDVRLSNSCSVLVLFSSYLERALQPPLALVLNRNAAHPQHAIHSHKFIETDRTKINLCENVWPSLVKQLTTETDSCVPTPLMLLSAAEDPMDWGPAFGHPATGHRREWNQRDAWGFRQRRDVKLLTPDGDVTSIFFGIRQPATLGSTPGVWPRRYAYHSTHAITIPRPSDRDEKVILRLATNYSWAGPNDPVVFTVRHETHGEGKMGRETIAELTPCSVLVNKVKFAERAARKRKEMEALALRINQGEDTRKQRKEAASKAARASHARDTEDRAGGGRKSQKATESAEWAVRIRDSHTVGRWRMWKQWVTPTGTIFFSRERKRGRRPQKTRPGDRMNPANRSQFDDGDPDDGDLNEEAYHCQWEQPRGWGTAVPDGEEWEDEDPEYALELDSGFHDGGADDGAETGKAPRLEDAKVSLATNGAPLNMENLAESLAANPAFLEMLGDKLDIPIAAAMRIRRAGRSVEERKADRKMLRHRGLEPNVGSTYAAVAPSFEVSQEVVARFGGGEQWWKARVARVHRDERRVKSMYIRAQDGKARPSIKRDADAAHFAHLRDLTGQGDRDLSVNAIKNRKRPHIPSLALGGSGPPGTGPNPNNMLGAVKDGNPNMGDYGAESESSEDEDRAAIMVVHSEKGFVPPTPRPFDVIDPGDGWRLLKPKHLPGDFVTLTTTSRPLGVRLGDGMNAGPPREMPGTVNPATELGYECFVPPPHAKAMFIGDVLQETERFDSMAFDGAAGGGGGGGGGASALAFASMSADGDASLLLGAGEREKREEQLRKAEQDMAIMDLTNTAFTAVRNNSMAQLEELLDDGVSAKDARDAAGNTLLHLAAQQGYKRISKLLLRRDADLNAVNISGCTVLHYCFAYHNEKLGDYFVSKGADDSIQNAEGLTCYEGLSREDLDGL